MNIRDRLEFAKRVAPLLTDASVRGVFDAIAENDYSDLTLLQASVDLKRDVILHAVSILKTCGLIQEQQSGTVAIYSLSIDGLHINKERNALPVPSRSSNNINHLSF